MVRSPCFDSKGMKRGAWSEDEDEKLTSFILRHGHKNWRLLPFYAGLARCGKSCRLRWMNYLKPGIKKGNYTKQEDLIIQLHNQLGNKRSAIAEKFPGRTDNDIKNHWHGHLKKRCINYRQNTGGHQNLINEHGQKLCEIGTNPCPKQSYNNQDHDKTSSNYINNNKNIKYVSLQSPPFKVNGNTANSLIKDSDSRDNSDQDPNGLKEFIFEEKRESFDFGVSRELMKMKMTKDSPNSPASTGTHSSMVRDDVLDWINDTESNDESKMVSSSSSSSNAQLF